MPLLDLPAEPRSVAIARGRVVSALADAPVDVAAVALAVTEAVSNALVHAYRHDAAPGRVRVRVTETDGAVDVIVSDDGCGVTPRLDSPGAGLGIPLMTRLAGHVEVDSAATGTRVLLRFGMPVGRPEHAPGPTRRFAREDERTTRAPRRAGHAEPV